MKFISTDDKIPHPHPRYAALAKALGVRRRDFELLDRIADLIEKTRRKA